MITQRHGYIDKNIFDVIRTSRTPLVTPTASKEANGVAGIRAILQQALRYADHYGTNRVILTDYVHGIVLILPKDWQTGQTKSAIEWAVIEKENIRRVVGFLIWAALKDMEQALRDAQVDWQNAQDMQELNRKEAERMEQEKKDTAERVKKEAKEKERKERKEKEKK